MQPLREEEERRAHGDWRRGGKLKNGRLLTKLRHLNDFNKLN